MSADRVGPLSDAVVTALARLVDDAKATRQPTHSEIEYEFSRAGVLEGDPKNQGQPIGKAKRVRAVLSWAIEHSPSGGERLVYLLLAMLRAKGGFRGDSPNYVGAEAVRDARDVFREEGFDLALDGTLSRLVLDELAGRALTKALRNYVRRAKRGADDAALLAGTSKDLVEATAKHVLAERYGQVGAVQNFPTLLGQAFVAVGLAHEFRTGNRPHQRVEAALYELACAVNQLRNREGTGHGRPFVPQVTKRQARTATESMGIVAEVLLDALDD